MQEGDRPQVERQGVRMEVLLVLKGGALASRSEIRTGGVLAKEATRQVLTEAHSRPVVTSAAVALRSEVHLAALHWAALMEHLGAHWVVLSGARSGAHWVVLSGARSGAQMARSAAHSLLLLLGLRIPRQISPSGAKPTARRRLVLVFPSPQVLRERPLRLPRPPRQQHHLSEL